MALREQNLRLDQGRRRTCVWSYATIDPQKNLPATPFNFTGSSVQLIARAKSGDTTTPLVNLTSGVGGGLVLDSVAGTITATFLESTTAGLTAGSYPFEMVITYADGSTKALVKGFLVISASTVH